jgi:hypothetical protein
MTRWGQSEQSPPPPAMDSGFHFHLGLRLGETVSELRALNGRMDTLPEQIALQLATHFPALRHGEPKMGPIRQTIHLLQSGLPYVVLAKRTSILVGLWILAGTGNFSPDQIADMIIKVIGSLIGG